MSVQAPIAEARPAAAALPRLVRFAVDSDEAGSLFPADFVRFYSDLVPGTAELAQLRARFPDSVVELIDRGLGDPTGQATIANIETGALTPAEGADRIRSWHAEGRTDLVAYCNEGDLLAVVAACQGLNYWHWIAAWGQMVVPSHRDAQVQFANAGMLGVHADLTVIWNPAYRPAAGTALAPAAAAVPELAQAADLAQLHGIAEGLKNHHGALALLERDLARIPELVGQHAALLSDLLRLVP